MANYKLTMAGWKGDLFKAALGTNNEVSLSDKEILENHWGPFCEVWKKFEEFYSKHIDLIATDPDFKPSSSRTTAP